MKTGLKIIIQVTKTLNVYGVNTFINTDMDLYKAVVEYYYIILIYKL